MNLPRYRGAIETCTDRGCEVRFGSEVFGHTSVCGYQPIISRIRRILVEILVHKQVIIYGYLAMVGYSPRLLVENLVHEQVDIQH